jgi:methylated-DNA-[protein]-cysteine S-methyltransferase
MPIRAATADLGYSTFETALGNLGLAWSDRGLAAVQLPERDEAASARRLRSLGARPAEPPVLAQDCIARLRAYAAGERVDFGDLPLDQSAVDEFESRVYAALRDVGWATTTTYGALAAAAGAPGAARAVGAAMGRNRWPVVVPCHRVLAAAGRMGGFSAFGGTLTKARLLRLEGARLPGEAPLLPGLLA